MSDRDGRRDQVEDNRDKFDSNKAMKKRDHNEDDDSALMKKRRANRHEPPGQNSPTASGSAHAGQSQATPVPMWHLTYAAADPGAAGRYPNQYSYMAHHVDQGYHSLDPVLYQDHHSALRQSDMAQHVFSIDPNHRRPFHSWPGTGEDLLADYQRARRYPEMVANSAPASGAHDDDALGPMNWLPTTSIANNATYDLTGPTVHHPPHFAPPVTASSELGLASAVNAAAQGHHASPHPQGFGASRLAVAPIVVLGQPYGNAQYESFASSQTQTASRQNNESGDSAHNTARRTKRRPATSLFMNCDEESLSDYQCLVRKQIEIFEAGPEDVRTNAQGRNKQVVLGQVGIRCKHCNHLPQAQRPRGAVYFPSRLSSIYQAGQNMATIHLCKHCRNIPSEIKDKLLELVKVPKSSAGSGKKYWADGARVLGVIETDEGLKFAN